jgi:hypothetical protein
MLIVLTSWIYILLLCLTAGTGMQKFLCRTGLLRQSGSGGISAAVMTGVAVLTLYAEYFSILCKVGAAAHLIMLALLAATAWKVRMELRDSLRKIRVLFCSPEGAALLFLIILTAFFTSRGEFHTDTGIYHAQAIRIIEDYGTIRGAGNLQLHFAYNSSYLVFAALFTMSWILPQALHTTTGFLAVFLICIAIHDLLQIRKHRYHGADAVAAGILLYYITNLTGSMSPATDYGTMYLILYLLYAWLKTAEKYRDGDIKGDVSLRYGILSVFAVFLVSEKLSAASLVILALSPFLSLLRQKQGRKIGAFLILGILSILPFLIRNVLISGWLIYPVESIDLFRVAWKIPAAYLEKDAAQIKVWGRCLYDVTRLHDPLSVWLPVWWSAQRSFERLLLLAQAGACLLILFMLISAFLHRRKIQKPQAVFYVTLAAGIALWFFTSPFIRYGLAFLLCFPLCVTADFIDVLHLETEKKPRNIRAGGQVLTVCVAAAVLICALPWTANYLKDDADFLVKRAADPYYLEQKPFEDSKTDSV